MILKTTKLSEHDSLTVLSEYKPCSSFELDVSLCLLFGLYFLRSSQPHPPHVHSICASAHHQPPARVTVRLHG